MEQLHQIKALVEEEQALEKDVGNESAANKKKGKSKKAKKPPTLEEQYARLARRYVQYYGVLRQLELWHDGMVQPQIRQDIKVVLELVICRILALRSSLEQLLSSDGTNNLNHIPFPGCIDVGSTLQTMKLSPSAMDPVIPRYIREVSAYHRLRDGAFELMLPMDVTASADDAEENSHTCTDKNEDSRASTCTTAEDQESIESLEDGSRTTLLREVEAVFIGMKADATTKADELECSARYAYDRRKQKQQENKEAYEVALDEIREEVRKEEGSEIYEKLYDERMRWISDQSSSGNVPDSLEGFYLNIPNADAGKNDTKEDTSKKGGGSSSSATDPPAEDPESISNREPQLLHDLLNSLNMLEQRWKLENGGSYDREFAKETVVRPEIEQSTRESVDESVMVYLQRLRASTDAGAQRKAAGKKGGGGSKKKKEKPLPGEKICSSMDTMKMLQILIEKKLVADCCSSQINSMHLVGDFVGSTGALSSSLVSSIKSASSESNGNWDRKDPSMNQLQLAVSEYCILPNASSTMKESVPDDDNVRAILFYGPQGCGKRDMVKAVANQLGALLISLSPELVKDQFLDKTETTRLIHLVFAVAQSERFGPVVLNIDDCEQFFQSPTGKQVDKSGPVRFQKDLLIYKNQAIQKKDRVIIIGTTAHPELLDPKICQYKGSGSKPEKQGMFEKFLFFPPPNYVDRLLLWKAFVSEKAGDDERRCIDFSSLAFKSEGFTAGSIRRSVESTREALLTSEAGIGGNQGKVSSEKDLLAQLESLDMGAVGSEDRMRFVNFAKARAEQKPSGNGAGASEKKGGKAKAPK